MYLHLDPSYIENSWIRPWSFPAVPIKTGKNPGNEVESDGKRLAACFRSNFRSLKQPRPQGLLGIQNGGRADRQEDPGDKVGA